MENMTVWFILSVFQLKNNNLTGTPSLLETNLWENSAEVLSQAAC